MAERYDVIIVGGGIIGTSIAYNLAHDGFKGKIAVFEMDPTYGHSTTALSNAGIREQFSTEINNKISMYALDILEKFEEEMAVDGEPAHIDFKRTGYLFIATNENQMAILRKNHALQKGLGAKVELLKGKEILGIIPDCYIGDIAGASFGKRDGHLDPWGFLQAYIKKGKSLGVKYIYDEVTNIMVENGRIAGVKTRHGDKFSSPIVVDAAGPWSGGVARMAGVDLPVVPLRRMMFIFKAHRKFNYIFPLIIDGIGVVFRNETSEQFHASRTKEDELPGFNFSVDYDFFNNVIWPEVAHRIPVLETLKLIRGYAGAYDANTIDSNAIIGKHPEISGFYLASGFSGHGIQQAPAVGKGISEFIRIGKYETTDLSPLRFERFKFNELVIEESFLYEGLKKEKG